MPRPKGEGGAVDMAAPLTGQCREQLHALPLLEATEHGPRCVGWFSDYPGRAGQAPACSRYAGRHDGAMLARGDGAEWWDRTLCGLVAAQEGGNEFAREELTRELDLRWRTAGASERADVIGMLAAAWELLADRGVSVRAEPAASH